MEKSLRRNAVRALTSAKAGKIVPLAYAPLLREDRVQSGRMRVRFEMMETAELLMNGVDVTVHAHFVPFLAFDRFNGMDQFNRSYMGEPESDGDPAIPFIDTMAYNRAHEFWATMGIHAKNNAQINSAPLEAYNCLVNYLRRARSTRLPVRDRLDTTLATAFWRNVAMRHIVPDYEQALIDGEVPLTFTDTLLPVKGIGVREPHRTSNQVNNNIIQTGNDWTGAGTPSWQGDSVAMKVGANDVPEIFAEMQQTGITVSLQNIEMAKKTAAFARVRAQYSGLEDEHVIDLLMQAIRVPEENLSQPILLDRKSTLIGYNQRYATDGANLDQSVTTGESWVDLNFRTPAMNTGGIILVTCQITPEQLWERQKDHFLHAQSVEAFPQFIRDFNDPEKVAIVTNDHVDVDHANPDETFGYAPLNHEWQRNITNIGGKYFRPEVDAAFDEDRQKIWAVETANPTLTEDFYLCTNLHHKPFADQNADPFEITTVGGLEIVGNTVFGKGLHENTADYDAIADQVDETRIEAPELE